MYEWIGILASVIILIGFVIKGEIRIRIINMVGAVLMVIYGALIGAFSVYFVNGMIILVHMYYIIKSKNNRHITQ